MVINYCKVNNMNDCKFNINDSNVLISFTGNCETITLPKGIIEIGSRAFENCKDLKSIQFNKELKVVKNLAFNNCSSLEEVSFNEGIETIYDCAFQNCSSLKSIKIPSSLKQFVLFDENYSIFDGCPNIESIVIDERNTNYSSCRSNVIFDKRTSTLLFGCSTSKIPPETKIIGSRSFYKQVKLKSIELPEQLETIKNEAFYGCHQLKQLYIPKRVTKICFTSFIGSKLDHIEVDTDNLSYKVVDNVLIEKNNNVTVLATKQASVPDCVSGIGDYSFAFNIIKKIYIPSPVKTIGALAFMNSEMEEVFVREGTQEILDRAFYGCHNLKTVYLPHSLMNNIDYDMDFGVAKSAFFDCPSLHTIIFNGTKEEWLRLLDECNLFFKNIEVKCID